MSAGSGIITTSCCWVHTQSLNNESFSSLKIQFDAVSVEQEAESSILLTGRHLHSLKWLFCNALWEFIHSLMITWRRKHYFVNYSSRCLLWKQTDLVFALIKTHELDEPRTRTFSSDPVMVLFNYYFVVSFYIQPLIKFSERKKT